MTEKEDKTHKYAFWMAAISIIGVTIIGVAKEIETVSYWAEIKDFFNSVFLQTLAIVASVYFGLKGIDRQHERNKELKQFEFYIVQRKRLEVIAFQIKGKSKYTAGMSMMVNELANNSGTGQINIFDVARNLNKLNIFFEQKWQDEIPFLQGISDTLSVLISRQLKIMNQIEEVLEEDCEDETTIRNLIFRYQAFTNNAEGVLGEFKRINIEPMDDSTPVH